MEDAIPRICEHLGNGAKRFLLTTPHHAVAGFEARRCAFDPAAFDSNAFATGGLFVELKAEEAAELGTERIRAIELARGVSDYWERRGVGK